MYLVSNIAYLGGRPKCTTRGRLKVYQGRWPLSELKMYHR